ncbi:MAG: sigma-70 family RNA polymerase sigma factor [Ruminococcus sp.]|nr:sigma-70 family RNA polymerase sigma factor [Ruminococcus sp.]
MEDKKLIELLKASPQKGLSEIVMSYSPYVYKIAFTKLRDICTKEDIEEAVSDVFLKFYQSGMACGFELRSVRGLLAVIAARHCTDIFRSRCNGFETVALSELENVLAVTDTTDGKALIDAVKSLGEPDSSIFIRKYYLGQKNKDIAKELKMRQGTVNTRISRGLDKLRKILEEDM